MSDRAVRISQAGGPEVLTIEPVQVGDPGPGEIRIRHAACGLNYIDIYHRSGVYPLPLPSGLGMEGVYNVTTLEYDKRTRRGEGGIRSFIAALCAPKSAPAEAR